MTDFQAKAKALASLYTGFGIAQRGVDIAWSEQDWFEQRAKYNLNCALDWRVIGEENPLNPAPVVTKHGTVMKRYQGKAGKQMGRFVYIHRDYSYVLPNPERVYRAELLLCASHPKFFLACNCIRYDLDTGMVRFDQAPDFNTLPEPTVGNWVLVDPEIERVVKEGCTAFIWHHKWMWVMDDYTGFDVHASRAWSRIWLKKISNPSGSRDIWVNQIKTAGL